MKWRIYELADVCLVPGYEESILQPFIINRGAYPFSELKSQCSRNHTAPYDPELLAPPPVTSDGIPLSPVEHDGGA